MTLKQQFVSDTLRHLKSLQDKSIPNGEKRIRMFYPTTIQELNTILSSGLVSPNTNFQLINDKETSYEDYVVTFTSKWHYFQSVNLANLYSMELHGENALRNPELQWWNSFETLPCYVEFYIPESILLPSPEFLESNYVQKKIKSAENKNKPFSVNWNESFSQHATVSAMGVIPRDWIVSFTVMADGVFLLEHFLHNQSQYMKDYLKWKEGKSKGKLSLEDLLHTEKKSSLNGTWYMNRLPELFLIKQFHIDPAEKKLLLDIQEF